MIRITNLFLILCALPALLLAQEIIIKNTLHRNYTLTEGKINNKTIRLDTYNPDGYLIDFYERRKK